MYLTDLPAQVQFTELRVKGPKAVNQANAEYPQGQAVGAGEAKDPEHVADEIAVGWRWSVHDLTESTVAGRTVQLQGPSAFV